MRASQKGVLALAMVTLMAMQGCLSAIVSDTASQTTEEMDAIQQLDPDAYTCFTHNGWERCYITYIPENIDSS